MIALLTSQIREQPAICQSTGTNTRTRFFLFFVFCFCEIFVFWELSPRAAFCKNKMAKHKVFCLVFLSLCHFVFFSFCLFFVICFVAVARDRSCTIVNVPPPMFSTVPHHARSVLDRTEQSQFLRTHTTTTKTNCTGRDSKPPLYHLHSPTYWSAMSTTTPRQTQ